MFDWWHHLSVWRSKLRNSSTFCDKHFLSMTRNSSHSTNLPTTKLQIRFFIFEFLCRFKVQWKDSEASIGRNDAWCSKCLYQCVITWSVTWEWASDMLHLNTECWLWTSVVVWCKESFFINKYETLPRLHPHVSNNGGPVLVRVREHLGSD